MFHTTEPQEVQVCPTESHACCFRGFPLLLNSGKELSAAGSPACCVVVKDMHVHTVIPVDFCIIQRNVSVGVGLFYTPRWSHQHTLFAALSTSHFLSHTYFSPFLHMLTQLLFSCSPLVVLLLYSFCLAGCFADRLQLDVVAGIEAGSWVCRLASRDPLHGESPHNTPTHLSPRRDSSPPKGTSLDAFIC